MPRGHTVKAARVVLLQVVKECPKLDPAGVQRGSAVLSPLVVVVLVLVMVVVVVVHSAQGTAAPPGHTTYITINTTTITGAGALAAANKPAVAEHVRVWGSACLDL